MAAKIRKYLMRGALAATMTSGAAIVAAQDSAGGHMSMYGTPGMVEMPSAYSLPDGNLDISLSGFSLQQRMNLTFQISPRLTGVFRYAHIDKVYGANLSDTYDRSFDLQYRLVDEGQWMPAIAVGLRDFAGTGLLTSEYFVASKSFGDRLAVSGGIGWGRLGSYNGFSNPLSFLGESFEDRGGWVETGGVPSIDQYFRGDAALFGGMEYKINPKLTFVAEYSSDGFTREVGNGSFDRKTPLNFGISYKPSNMFEFSAYSLHGSDYGFMATTFIDPNYRPTVGGIEPAPIPVRVRAADARAAQTWNRQALPDETLRDALSQLLATEGVVLDSAEIQDKRLRVRYTNTRYRTETQALGRVARLLTQGAPDSIEEFVLEPMAKGIPMSSTVIRRSDLEQLENRPGAAEEIFSRRVTTDALSYDGLVAVNSDASKFSWGLLPYAELSLFNAVNPAQFEAGVELRARYAIQPNLVLAGNIKQEVFSDRIDPQTTGTTAQSQIEPVRTYQGYYNTYDGPGIEKLTLTYYGRPASNIYTRVTGGMFEKMFGGVSTEVLWKPVDSNVALGAELNYAVQRDFNMGLGFGYTDPATGLEHDYSTMTGHVSAYLALNNGYHTQVDIGRYLAGDWGATFSLDREFANGWKVGAYATLTDVPFEDFGEGSFDKGIRITIPMDWGSGQAVQKSNSNVLNSLQRDGGARLDVDGRLYETIRNGHLTNFDDSWGRFWR